MRRWTLLLAGAALWLFLAAVPALADGGPHVAAANSGVSTLTADSCAGCHRAHTAQGALLLVAPEEEICLTCHGAASTGATTDVMTGVQYAVGTGGLRGTTQLGALRNGGFDQARIDAGVVTRESYLRNATAVSQRPKVGVGAPEDVTSAHIAMDENGLTLPGIAWGNGAFSATANPGPAADLSCGSCHNVHGNGQFRILNPIPGASGIAADATANPVDDAPLPADGGPRNYTVLQTKGTEGDYATYLLTANQVAAAAASGTFNGLAGDYGPTGGDYFRRNVPWTPTVNFPGCDPTAAPTGGDCATAFDAPNGKPSSFLNQMTQWCSACHTRYLADGNTPVAGNPYDTDSGDAIFKFRHPTRSNRTCTECHVTHGSNAEMPGTFSANFPYPDGTISASSRLLKIDNRGTCQACHDPTGTVPAGTYLGPVQDVP